MSSEFYGATQAAQQTINGLLGLPASGREQDWEMELADPTRIHEMLEVASRDTLSFDEKCAACLLLIASLEKANEAGELEQAVIQETQRLLAANPPVQEAMDFFWIKQKQAEDEDLVQTIVALKNRSRV